MNNNNQRAGDLWNPPTQSVKFARNSTEQSRLQGLCDGAVLRTRVRKPVRVSVQPLVSTPLTCPCVSVRVPDMLHLSGCVSCTRASCPL